MTIWIFRFLAKAQNDKFFVVLTCHTECSEVSIKFKVWICLFKAWIFYLKFKVSLKFYGFFAFYKRLKMTSSVDSSPAAQNDKAQNDNSGVDFSLVSLAQNDSSVNFSLRLRLASRLVAFYKRLKMTKPCRLCKSCICLAIKGKHTSYENPFFYDKAKFNLRF